MTDDFFDELFDDDDNIIGWPLTSTPFSGTDDPSEFLKHYGVKRRSGRYPFGSGEDPYQHERNFLTTVRGYRKDGLSDKEIVKLMDLKDAKELRSKMHAFGNDVKKANIRSVQALATKGYTPAKIAEKTGLPWSTVKQYMNADISAVTGKTEKTAELLKDYVDKNKMVDVGLGTEVYLGVSETRKKHAIELLEKEGYHLEKRKLGKGEGTATTMLTLCAPDVDEEYMRKHKYEIAPIMNVIVDQDGDVTRLGTLPPVQVSKDRVMVRYGEDGGKEKDGTIELRRGVDDISLGKANYAQVRIAVEGNRFLKGVALYKDDMPPGVDIVFNTNKSKEDYPDPMDTLKAMKGVDKHDPSKGTPDKDNPFGASIKEEADLRICQRFYVDENGNRKQSAINVVNEEGTWNKWNKATSSQLLAKQTPEIAKRQLDQKVADFKKEFEDIKSLNNKAIMKHYLEDFAGLCDSAAEELKGAPFPKQATKLILPINGLKDNEVYCPTLKEGTKAALVRFPLASITEIPILTVVNRNKEAKATIGVSAEADAIGINHKVAARMSGADFDGDTVLVIPLSSKVKINNAPVFEALKNFETTSYTDKGKDFKKMDSYAKGLEMGKVSNLINDMTLKGAAPDEIARAMKHSMVVIDAEKHELNYRRSELDNDIAGLKDKYQNNGVGLNGKPKHGASTLISRARSETHVPEQKRVSGINRLNTDPETGERIIRETGRQYYQIKKIKDKDGKVVDYVKTDKLVKAMTTSNAMRDTKDAFTLSSGTRMETVYANFANQMKALANEARKEYLKVGTMEYKPEANKKYKDAVTSLDSKLKVALSNSPKERQALQYAKRTVAEQIRANPSIKDDKDKKKKLEQQAINAARNKFGAKKETIKITPYEWEAIQAGAISENKLNRIIRNTDTKNLRSYAMPKEAKVFSTASISLAKQMFTNGYTQADIAERLGCSTSSVSEMLK